MCSLVTELAFKHTIGWAWHRAPALVALNRYLPTASPMQWLDPSPTPRSLSIKVIKGRHVYFSPAALATLSTIHHLWEANDTWKVTSPTL